MPKQRYSKKFNNGLENEFKFGINRWDIQGEQDFHFVLTSNVNIIKIKEKEFENFLKALLKAENYLLSVDNNTYILQPKTANELFEVFFLINPSHFKLNSQQFLQTEESRFLEIVTDLLK